MRILDAIIYGASFVTFGTATVSKHVNFAKVEAENTVLKDRIETVVPKVEHDTVVTYVIDTVEKKVEVKVTEIVYVDVCERGFAAKDHYYVSHDSLVAPTTHGDAKYPVIKPHANPIKSDSNGRGVH